MVLGEPPTPSLRSYCSGTQVSASFSPDCYTTTSRPTSWEWDGRFRSGPGAGELGHEPHQRRDSGQRNPKSSCCLESIPAALGFRSLLSCLSSSLPRYYRAVLVTTLQVRPDWRWPRPSRDLLWSADEEARVLRVGAPGPNSLKIALHFLGKNHPATVLWAASS